MKPKNSEIFDERAAFESHKRKFTLAAEEADIILDDRQIDIDSTEAIIEQLEDDEVQKLTRLLVYSTNEISHIIDRNRRFDKDRVISFNHALRDIITEFEDTYLSPEALIKSIMTFAVGRGLVRDHERKAVFEGLSSDFIGMWNEQAFENMACFAGIPNKYGDTQDDRDGKDIYIAIGPEKWVSIDVKSSKNSLINHMPYDSGDHKSKLITLKDPSKSNMDASYENPVISVLHDKEHFLVSIDYGNIAGRLPDQIAAPNFKQLDKQSVSSIFGSLINYMQRSRVQNYEYIDAEFVA